MMVIMAMMRGLGEVWHQTPSTGFRRHASLEESAGSEAWGGIIFKSEMLQVHFYLCRQCKDLMFLSLLLCLCDVFRVPI